MFGGRTLFVVGAGASKDVGLPTGAELADQIRDKLYIEFRTQDQKSGDKDIARCLQSISTDKQLSDDNPYYVASRQISRALRTNQAIDVLLDRHGSNGYMNKCGKMAIVKSILGKEAECDLSAQKAHPRRVDAHRLGPDLSLAGHSWFPRLADILMDRVGDAKQIFKNVRFIVFNYDRCLEHYLFHLIKDNYLLQDKDAAAIVKEACILHPYGSIGPLPWQDWLDAPRVPCGDEEMVDLNALSDNIKIYTERQQNMGLIGIIKNEVNQASKIVFLGFSFLSNNMQILRPEKAGFAEVFSTSKGLSSVSCDIVKRNLRVISGAAVSTETQLDCVGLFYEYLMLLKA